VLQVSGSELKLNIWPEMMYKGDSDCRLSSLLGYYQIAHGPKYIHFSVRMYIWGATTQLSLFLMHTI
jgi:hypothetical protein